MAQPGPEVAVASVCLIAVLYNYEQWRDIVREREREREKPGEGQKPAECHVKCIPGEIDGDAVRENESQPTSDREKRRETERDREQRG